MAFISIAPAKVSKVSVNKIFVFIKVVFVEVHLTVI